MRKASWSLEDAKNGFSAVVAAARRGRPQTVTKHGRPAVVVVAVEEFERLLASGRANAPRFNELLLAMPTDDGAFERLKLRLRDDPP
jgi:prevent-host-death family protein